MGELLSVKVSIANRTYPLRITKDEEEKVVHAAQSVNKCIKEFEDNYAVKDKQDLLAMCSLQFASESMGQHKKGSKQEDHTQQIITQLDKLGSVIDDYLAGEQHSS
ncbi:MAG: cell division protein ZapA [Bacteroidetes bacterium]|nr:cell division protein ZapA [Bacteroidota bacterium]